MYLKRYFCILFFLVFSIAFSLFFCSCENFEEEAFDEILTDSYTATASITENQTNYSVSIAQKDGELDFSFTKPEVLTGISYKFTKDNASMTYNDVKIPLSSEKMKENAYHGVYLWKNLLQSSGNYEVKTVKENESKFIILTYDKNCSIKFDYDKKIPVSLTYENTVINFDSFETISNQG